MSKFRTFKDYYTRYVQRSLKSAFPTLVSYQRFVELMPRVIVPLFAFIKQRRLGQVTGISFIDSTPIKVCHIKRKKQNRVFAGLAAKGRTTKGRFYGFKLHLVINEKREILSFFFTPGNSSAQDEKVIDNLVKNFSGKLFADKGYISQKLFEKLWQQGLQLITKIRKI